MPGQIKDFKAKGAGSVLLEESRGRLVCMECDCCETPEMSPCIKGMVHVQLFQ